MVGPLPFKDTPTELRDSGPAPFLTFPIRLRFAFERYKAKNYSTRISYHHVNLCFVRKMHLSFIVIENCIETLSSEQ